MIRDERTVVFDFDGLLVDTETAEFQAWQRLYTEQGGALDVEIWQHAVGYDGRVNPRALLEEQVGRELDWTVLVPLKQQYHIELIEKLPPLPGAERLIRRCVELGLKVGVASNSSSEWVRAGLTRVGFLDYVTAFACRDEVANPKPLPDVYQLALSKLNALPEKTVAFEDSEPGARSAKAAGVYVVAIPNEFTRLQDLSMADLLESSLENIEIERLFEQLVKA